MFDELDKIMNIDFNTVLFEVNELKEKISKIPDDDLVDTLCMIADEVPFVYPIDKVVENYFMNGELSEEDRHFLEMSYIVDQCPFMIRSDGEIMMFSQGK